MKKLLIYLAAGAMLTAWVLLPEPETEPVKVTVKRGDTLFEICAELKAEYGDKRGIQEIVYYAKKQNGIGNHDFIHPGDELVIEIEKGE